MDKEFELAIQQICDEKGISKEIVMETMNAAIASAYRKDYGTPNQRIKAEFNPETKDTKVFRVFEVVEEEDLENEEAQITLKEARKKKKGIKIGDEITEKIDSPPTEFGRIAAQTAKQVIIQRIREAERDVLFTEFQTKEKSVVNGTVQQIELKSVIIDLGKINGILPVSEQIPNEKYYIGQRLKVYVKSVEETTRGPQVILTRADKELIRKLFEIEVPEITSGSVEIKDIAREPGRRTKVSVLATQEGVDPVGSCIGQRGTRVQSILAEIGEEKIDIVLWDEKDETHIINALSPAKIKSVKLTKNKKAKEGEYQGKAEIIVESDQLSLAIGKDGQNVRLASKLCNWDIDVLKKEAETETADIQKTKQDKKKKSKTDKKEDSKKKKEKIDKTQKTKK
ncbi:transcription termination factor NusA [Patescibacteria group bacterium]